MHRLDHWQSIPTTCSSGLQQDDVAHEKATGDIKFGGRGREEEDRHRLGLITVVKAPSWKSSVSVCVCVWPVGYAGGVFPYHTVMALVYFLGLSPLFWSCRPGHPPTFPPDCLLSPLFPIFSRSCFSSPAFLARLCRTFPTTLHRRVFEHSSELRHGLKAPKRSKQISD